MSMRVMLVDDHPLFLEGLQYLLESHGIEVAGTAGNGSQALEKARLLKPDTILMDIEMPGCSGLEAIVLIKEEMPEVKIVMLTSFDDDENLFEAIRRGASGYLLKNLNAQQLFDLLHRLEKGDAPLSPGLAARVLAEFACQAGKSRSDKSSDRMKEMPRQENGSELTERQTEVLNLVAQGRSYKEIGVVLNLSERTIKYHMERILELLHLENRAQLITYAALNKRDANGR